MCGIAGYIGRKPLEQKNVARTLDLMKNRGPDNSDFFSCETNGLYVSLLHSRLSIIDLDKRSNQPFVIGNQIVVFNGEIYNYVELREEMVSQGVEFKTSSDTEVLLQAYIKYGKKCVDKFEGMWSFAIFDRNNEKLFLSRDRFAEKPLFYIETPFGFYFGSEIKFIKALSEKRLAVNHSQIKRYLVNGYKSLYKQEETFFEEVKELSFAFNMIINR